MHNVQNMFFRFHIIIAHLWGYLQLLFAPAWHAESEVTGLIYGTGPTLRVLKWLRNKGTVFALQMART